VNGVGGFHPVASSFEMSAFLRVCEQLARLIAQDRDAGTSGLE
jgi:hypothetical protein